MVCVLLLLLLLSVPVDAQQSFHLQRLYQGVDSISTKVDALGEAMLEAKYHAEQRMDSFDARLIAIEAALARQDMTAQTRGQRVWEVFLGSIPPLIVVGVIALFKIYWDKYHRDRRRST